MMSRIRLRRDSFGSADRGPCGHGARSWIDGNIDARVPAVLMSNSTDDALGSRRSPTVLR